MQEFFESHTICENHYETSHGGEEKLTSQLNNVRIGLDSKKKQQNGILHAPPARKKPVTKTKGALP